MLPNTGIISVARSGISNRKRDLVSGRYDLPGLHKDAGVAVEVLEMMNEQATAAEAV